MIINEENHFNLSEMIMEWLSTQDEMKSAARVANAIKKSHSQTKEELTRLVVLGRIRKGGTKSCPAYYIPSRNQIEKENSGLVNNFKPLKQRSEHLALLTRIKEERNAYKSLT